MKKIISVLAALALVGGITAGNKKPAKAKASKKAAAAAPVKAPAAAPTK